MNTYSSFFVGGCLGSFISCVTMILMLGPSWKSRYVYAEAEQWAESVSAENPRIACEEPDETRSNSWCVVSGDNFEGNVTILCANRSSLATGCIQTTRR
jgi:hypothetical protein